MNLPSCYMRVTMTIAGWESEVIPGALRFVKAALGIAPNKGKSQEGQQALLV
jgi:hypothetical protein